MHKEIVTLFVPDNTEFAKESLIIGYTRAQLAASFMSKFGYMPKEINGTEFNLEVFPEFRERLIEIAKMKGLEIKEAA